MLLFQSGNPGNEWLRCFCKRPNLKFNDLSSRKAEMHACKNATTLVEHMLKAGDAITKFNINAIRLLKLDETGMCTDNNSHRASRKCAHSFQIL